MTDADGWPAAYACVDVSATSTGGYAIRAIRWSDREAARTWRNDQLDILRQAEPLSAVDQDRYYAEVVRPQLDEATPAQVLVGLVLGDELIGYGGLVHIDWTAHEAEVSFITDTPRQVVLADDLGAFLTMIDSVAARMGIARLTTEVYAFREDYLDIASRAGFVLVERRPDHVEVGGRRWDSLRLARPVVPPG